MNAWSNYDDVLGQLRAFGLVVDVLNVGPAPQSGGLWRCKVEGDAEKRGWYLLHEFRPDNGEVLLVGSYGVWRGNEQNTQKVELTRRELSADQKAALKAKIAADQKAAEAARKKDNARAAEAAGQLWRAAAHEGTSAYLARKQIKAHGVRFTGDGLTISVGENDHRSIEGGQIVLPLCDVSGRVHGVQLIRGEKKHGRDKDFWPAGMAKKGHFFLIGAPTWICLVAEGYATAASLHEATGLPVAVAIDAGNLRPVAEALRKRYPRIKFLICGDDDHVQKCRACGEPTVVAVAECAHCGKPHEQINPGLDAASSAALAVGGSWMGPTFAADRGAQKITDFNDLHVLEGLHVVRAQVEAHLSALGWAAPERAARAPGNAPGGRGEDLRALEVVEEMQERFALVYEMADTVFDGQEHKLVPLASMRNLCVSRQVHRQWMESREKRVVRVAEVGFDPAGKDAKVKCNLWGGWPTVPRAGRCERLLELLEYLCSDDEQSATLYQWVLRWLAYPIQHPGAKMATALVLHGPQGTGKNLFFETIMTIYGEYGRIVDQAAVEDKFNDWASRKLFLIADEVVARMELYHTKNKLKSLITGEWVRINPKNIGAYDERNHVNLVFLSNENQPLVLEKDDRRYTVIWTPAKLDARFYEEVAEELRNGGAAALHDYLLSVPLADFGPHTKPPMTKAKEDLIELGKDSTERFWDQWVGKQIPLSVCACKTEDLYNAYRYWCTKEGIVKPAQANTFLGNCAKRPGATRARRQHFVNLQSTVKEQSTVIFPPYADAAIPIRELTEQIVDFAAGLAEWRENRPYLREAA